jgi:hypothetical protein
LYSVVKADLSYANSADRLEAFIRPIFQRHWEFLGRGKSCPTNQTVRIRGNHNRFLQRLLVLDLLPFVPGAEMLQDCISHFMNNKANTRLVTTVLILTILLTQKRADGVVENGTVYARRPATSTGSGWPALMGCLLSALSRC